MMRLRIQPSLLLFVFHLLLTLRVVATAFIHPPPQAVSSFTSPKSASARYGMFDGFKKTMEAGYAGEDSAYNKQKALDEKKRNEKKNRNEQRRAKGVTELKDVKQKTFAKTKYDYSGGTDDSDDDDDDKKSE